MEHQHTINGLFRKRQEVSDRLDLARAQVADLVAAVDAVDLTLRLFGMADGPPEKRVRRLPVSRHPAHRNDQSRLILSLLREHGESTLRELTGRIMASRLLDAEDKALTALIRKRVACSLRHLRIAGRVESEGDARTGVRWRLFNLSQHSSSI